LIEGPKDCALPFSARLFPHDTFLSAAIVTAFNNLTMETLAAIAISQELPARIIAAFEKESISWLSHKNRRTSKSN
jgi:hypothetical protein